MRTTTGLRWLLTAGKLSPALKAATLLYLHGVRISVSTRLQVREIDFSSSPTMILVPGSRFLYVTDELSGLLKGLAAGRSRDDFILGYRNIPQFHAEFRRMARTSKMYNFDLSDVKELFKAAAGSDYALLKGHRSEEPRTPEEIRAAWLKVLPRLVVGA